MPRRLSVGEQVGMLNTKGIARAIFVGLLAAFEQLVCTYDVLCLDADIIIKTCCEVWHGQIFGCAQEACNQSALPLAVFANTLYAPYEMLTYTQKGSKRMIPWH
eukprot:2055478-Amphidinium_carterae.1